MKLENIPVQKNNTNPVLEKFKNSEMKQLNDLMDKLVFKIKDKIENCEYNLILGEDSSGRIPTLVISKICNEIYKRKNKISPKVLFLAGARHFASNKKVIKSFQEHIRNYTPPNTQKALVVTEYIDMGSSITTTIKSLKGLKIDYDIAACSVDEWAYKNNYKEEIKDHLYYGDFVGAPKILGKSNLSGVKKESGNILSESVNKNVSRSREDVNILSRKLLEEIF